MMLKLRGIEVSQTFCQNSNEVDRGLEQELYLWNETVGVPMCTCSLVVYVPTKPPAASQSALTRGGAEMGSALRSTVFWGRGASVAFSLY